MKEVNKVVLLDELKQTLTAYEEPLKDFCRGKISRGKLEISVTVEENGAPLTTRIRSRHTTRNCACLPKPPKKGKRSSTAMTLTSAAQP